MIEQYLVDNFDLDLINQGIRLLPKFSQKTIPYTASDVADHCHRLIRERTGHFEDRGEFVFEAHPDGYVMAVPEWSKNENNRLRTAALTSENLKLLLARANVIKEFWPADMWLEEIKLDPVYDHFTPDQKRLVRSALFGLDRVSSFRIRADGTQVIFEQNWGEQVTPIDIVTIMVSLFSRRNVVKVIRKLDRKTLKTKMVLVGSDWAERCDREDKFEDVVNYANDLYPELGFKTPHELMLGI